MKGKCPQHAKIEITASRRWQGCHAKSFIYKLVFNEECSQFLYVFSLKPFAKVHQKSLSGKVRLRDKRDKRKVLIKLKEEGKAKIQRILSNVDSLKGIETITSNFKLNIVS